MSVVYIGSKGVGWRQRILESRVIHLIVTASGFFMIKMNDWSSSYNCEREESRKGGIHVLTQA